VASARNVSHDEPALAAAPDGRVWVAWIEGVGGRNRIVARRSNLAGTAFGAVVTAPTPSGGLANGSVNLSAQVGRVDVLGLIATTGNASTLQHTQLLPGLTLVAGRAGFVRGKRQSISLRVHDAGDPVVGARVSIGGKSATTNAAGRASVQISPRPGARVLRATAAKAGYIKANLTLRAR
jgi:hypothetical protein